MDQEIKIVKEQTKWIAEKVDRMDSKLDRLIESHAFFKGKMVGVSLVVSAVVGIGIEIARAMF